MKFLHSNKYNILAIFLFLTVFSVGQVYSTNEYYNASGNPHDDTLALAATIRAEYDSVEDMADMLPELSGNANRPVFVNSAEDRLEAVTAASARAKLDVEIGVDVQAYDANLPTWPSSVDATEVSNLNGSNENIQTSLDGKADLAGDTFTGDVYGLTAPAGTSDTRFATNEFVMANGGSTSPGRNLLYNTDFVLNQAGYVYDGSQYIIPDEYAHDMWKGTGDTGSSMTYRLESNGDITITYLVTTASGTDLVAGLEQASYELFGAANETLTLSFYVVSLSSSMYVDASGLGAQEITTTGQKSFTYTGGSVSGTYARFRIYQLLNGPTSINPNFRIRNLKIERGSTYTTWDKPDPILQEKTCYKYFYKSRLSANRNYPIFQIFYGGYAFFPMTVEMYNLGGLNDGLITVTSNDLTADDGTTSKPATCSVLGEVRRNGVSLQCTASGGLNSTWNVFLNSYSSYIQFDARL